MVPRRSFLALAAAAPLARAFGASAIPIGLEMYSVRDPFEKDPIGTLTAVAAMGYRVVEIYGPYYRWPRDFVERVRVAMDNLGLSCFSTHNDNGNFQPDAIRKAIDYNSILGSRYLVMASAGTVNGLDGWKTVAEKLTLASEIAQGAGLNVGYHNHKTEFDPLEGRRPIEVIAENTPNQVMLQFDIGTCVQAGSDPVAWIKANPGRIRSIHCKDWSATPGKGFKILFGEGSVRWADIFQAAESVGGIEFYLIEVEDSPLPQLEGAAQSLATWNRIRS